MRFLKRNPDFSDITEGNIIIFSHEWEFVTEVPDQKLSRVLSNVRGKVFIAYGRARHRLELIDWVNQAKEAGARLATAVVRIEDIRFAA
jgi:hypothetical protein